MKITNFSFTDEFWDDFDRMPEHKINQLMLRLSTIQRTRTIPISLNAHRADPWGHDVWIGYVNKSDRILYCIRDGGTEMHILRFLTHHKMEEVLNHSS